MNIEELFPGKYLKTSDLAGGVLQLVIASVQIELMQQTGEEKPVVRFHEEDRGLILNVTNKNAIVASYGPVVESWIGRPIVLFASMTDFGGKPVPCVRVRVPSAPAAPLQAVAPTVPVQPVAPAVAPEQPVAAVQPVAPTAPVQSVAPAPQPVVQPVASAAAAPQPADEVPF